MWFRLFRFRSPLLTESLVISFPRVTEMFQFTRYPTSRYLDLSVAFATRYPLLQWMDCSIRKPPDRRIITPPRRISLLYASFLGMSAQGIHYQLYTLQRTKESSRQLADDALFKKTPNEMTSYGSIPPYDVITHNSKKPVSSICPIYMEDTISKFLKSHSSRRQADSRSCRESRDQQSVVPSHASEYMWTRAESNRLPLHCK